MMLTRAPILDLVRMLVFLARLSALTRVARLSVRAARMLVFPARLSVRVRAA
jgi:hypothetical protein